MVVNLMEKKLKKMIKTKKFQFFKIQVVILTLPDVRNEKKIHNISHDVSRKKSFWDMAIYENQSPNGPGKG